MQRPATTTATEAPQGGAPDNSDLHFHDQGEPKDEGAPGDATTLAFDGLMKVSGDDDVGGDPYNRTGRFKRAVR
jgi:hypothetical protein